MRFTFPLLAATSFLFPLLSATQATTAWWSSLPPCVVTCAKSAAASVGCDVYVASSTDLITGVFNVFFVKYRNDLKCLCNSSTFLVDFRNCVELSCPITTTVDPATVFSNACRTSELCYDSSMSSNAYQSTSTGLGARAPAFETVLRTQRNS